jgi:hypothetical protein
LEQNVERWRELCKQAEIEHDPQRLIDLVAEINQLLEEKEKRLAQSRKTTAA